MSSRLRRGLRASAALIGAQTLLQMPGLSAAAQQPDTPSQSVAQERTTGDRSTSESATSEDRAPASTDRSSTGMKAASPQPFAAHAAMGDKAEIVLGQLALEKSQDQQVRDFAQRMVRDHSAADARLKKVATAEHIQLPDSLDAKHRALKQKLASLEGETFDREYMKEMAKDHDEDVALFESASQSPQMPDDLKQFAASTLPTLKEHQKQAHALAERERKTP